jgi:hypothetical protein
VAHAGQELEGQDGFRLRLQVSPALRSAALFERLLGGGAGGASGGGAVVELLEEFRNEIRFTAA